MLFNETETLKGYHYASLRDLYLTSKHGNNIWFCMKLNTMEKTKFPLLNVRVKTQPSGKFRRVLAALDAQSLFVPDILVDTFYDFAFKLPNITPKHTRILDLCPFSWNVGDEAARIMKTRHEYNEFIRRVTQQLSKHYYQETSKQLARLKKSAYIWAEIQDEILTYKPQSSDTAQEQLFITKDALKRILESHRSSFIGDIHQKIPGTGLTSYDSIVSYLFKRDLWETKPEWREFFLKLRILFRKGIAPQQRIHLWSEIGKTIYFVVLTEDRYRQYQTQSSHEVGGETYRSDDILTKSTKVYQSIKDEAEKVYIYNYQDLEDDIQYLKGTLDQKVLRFESHIRNICRTFIFWGRMYNDSKTDEKVRYVTTYSRSVLVLCQGLLTSQTCSYLEGKNAVDESQIFWLLISLVTYVLSSYYEIGQNVLRPDRINSRQPATAQKIDVKALTKFPNSYLKSNTSAGIRSDLLLLRLLLFAHEKELYSKFDELGLPLEYYFADYIPTLFFGLFNPGLTFRIWDIIFFEGTSFKRVKL